VALGWRLIDKPDSPVGWVVSLTRWQSIRPGKYGVAGPGSFGKPALSRIKRLDAVHLSVFIQLFIRI